jgi:hypothetical protein
LQRDGARKAADTVIGDWEIVDFVRTLDRNDAAGNSGIQRCHQSELSGEICRCDRAAAEQADGELHTFLGERDVAR